MNIPYLAYQAAAAHDRFWAIYPPRAQAMAETFATSPVAFTAAFPPSDRDPEDAPDGIAVIALSGVMSRAGMPCTESASTIDISRTLRSALRDPAVKAIVLDIDSPGGTVSGTADLAELVATAAKEKPVYAYIPDMACSAAYWVASQATAIWASPNAMAIGNIGIRASSADTSEAYAAEGVKMRHYVSGPYKGMHAEGVPIPDEHHDEMQRIVDQQAQAFFGAVGKGRKLEGEALAAVTDGRWFTATEAKANGLIDRTGSISDLYQAISNRTAFRSTHVPAARPAASASLPTKPMSKIKELIAQLRGNPEMAQAAGITDPASLDVLEAEANATGAPTTHQPIDPSVVAMIEKAQADAASAVATANAQMAAVAAGNLESRAENFAAGLINDRKAHGAQKESLKTLYRTAAMADGGGAAKLDEKGALVEGQNVAAVVATFKDAPQHQHGTQQIPDGDPNASRDLNSQVNAGDVIAFKKLSDLGKRTLAEKN